MLSLWLTSSICVCSPDGGHDSKEDAVACLQLMKWRIKEDSKREQRYSWATTPVQLISSRSQTVEKRANVCHCIHLSKLQVSAEKRPDVHHCLSAQKENTAVGKEEQVWCGNVWEESKRRIQLWVKKSKCDVVMSEWVWKKNTAVDKGEQVWCGNVWESLKEEYSCG